MKTRLLMIIAGLSVVGIFGALYVANMINNSEDQKAQEEWREIREDLLLEVKKSNISDPICFVTDRASSGEIGSAVTVDACFTLKQFEEMGCTKPMLEHLDKHSNVLDFESDGAYYLDFIGLPEGMSIEKFEECWDVILEKRPVITSKSKDGSKICPDGQDYDEVLFKCVISCEGDLVYNGYADSCTTELELKYHGFCNEGYDYSPKKHECRSEDGTQHSPLKDPPRTFPPEPEPVTSFPGLQVDVTGQQQVRRGTTHDIIVDVFRDANPVSDALVRITIEDYGKNVIRDFKGRTDDSGRFVFSWEIPKSFDDIKTLLAYVDVTDDVSAKTILFKFQVYCLPGETGCKVEGN